MRYRHTIVTIGLLIAAGDAFAQNTVVTTFSGSGSKYTLPFTVKDGWEVQYDQDGDSFQLSAYHPDGVIVDILVETDRPGKGDSYEPKGGKYYLGVNATGNWTIKIVQLKSQ
jgi:hypothetical protein